MLNRKNLAKRLSLSAGLLACVLSIPALAGDVIGRVTGVSLEKAVIEIDGLALAVADDVRVTSSPYSSGTGIARLGELSPGQVVLFEIEADRVTRIAVMPGLTEVPN